MWTCIKDVKYLSRRFTARLRIARPLNNIIAELQLLWTGLLLDVGLQSAQLDELCGVASFGAHI